MRIENNLEIRWCEGNGRRRVLRKNAQDLLGLFASVSKTITEQKPRMEKL